MTCLRSSRLVWCPIWQVHALRARINCFSFPLPSQWVWNLLYNGERRYTRLSETKPRHFVWPFFSRSFHQSALIGLQYAPLLSALNSLAEVQHGVKFCDVLSFGPRTNNLRTCHTLEFQPDDKLVSSLSVCVRLNAEELYFMADQVAPSGHLDVCQRPQSSNLFFKGQVQG